MSATAVAASAGLVATPAAAVPRPSADEPHYRIPVSPDDSPQELVAKASGVRPTDRQVAWQRLEKTAFLHLNVFRPADRPQE